MTVTLRPRAATEDVDTAVDISTTLAGRHYQNPLFLASGCAAAGKELAVFNDLTAIGGVVTKSIQLQPRSGRPTPRMAETASGMLNSIGLQGPGVEDFLNRDLAWLTDHGVNAVVSIAGSSVEDYARLASRLRSHRISALEVNISCPNVEDRGQVFACHERASGDVVRAVRQATPSAVPVFAKLSPDVTDIVAIARACLDAGADGLTLINTTLGIAIDPTAMRPVLAATTGGLSGPAIKPIALRCVWQVHDAFPDVPLMAVGGVTSGLDALEFVLAGANAVQLGTVLFHDPSAPTRITRELRSALVQRGIDSLTEVRGRAHREPMHAVPAEPDPPGDQPVEPAAPHRPSFEESP